MQKLAVKQLTEEKFQPYGRILTKPSSAPEAEEETHNWWGNVAEFSCNEIISAGILEAKRRNFIVSKLEQHKDSEEILIPICGNSILVVGVVDDTGKEVDKIGAFYFPDDRPVMLNSATLHWIPYPLAETSLYSVLFVKGTPERDLDFLDLESTMKLEF